MQTKLRIDSTLYRDAKAVAACEGITPAQFIESALQIQLKSVSRRKTLLPAFDSGASRDFDVLVLIHLAPT